MQFAGVCLITDKVKELKGFYESILQIPAVGDDQFCYFEFGDNHLSICSNSIMEDISEGSTEQLGAGKSIIEIGVDNVDNLYERVCQRGVCIIKPPTTQKWGIRSFWIKDLEGNIINFCCQVMEVER